ncbi:hypothetical protein [uncultured Duncaniella sp.]|uniref:hypothetical protein n=1 Tax=uncultured Duncaniella sp. TaxID=2768039 RepID=UPI002733881B|nr:hypothetical protein [uncultured Duncaniella sp.]
MATLKICVQKQRTDGTWPVYIRVTHKSRHGYIKTDKKVWGKGINPKTKEIKAPFVIQQLSINVVDYMERLNKRNISSWTLKEVIAFLKSGDEEISFSDYCRKYIHSMQDAGQVRNARNYEMAINHFEKYFGSNRWHTTMAYQKQWTTSKPGQQANTAMPTSRFLNDTQSFP